MDIKIGLADILLIAPLILMFIFSCIPITVKVLKGNKEPNANFVLVTTVIGLLLTAVAATTFSNSGGQRIIFHGALAFDGVSTWMNLMVVFLSMASLFLSFENMATKGRQFSEFVFLMLNSAIGMMIVASANDLIVLFIGIEMMSLSLYLLIALSHETTLSKEAAFKYFVLGSFASAIFLYGIAFIFGIAGTTQVHELALKASELANTNRLFMMGLLMVILGFCFKVSIFPLQAWTPDVYQGAPTPVTAFMATAVKAVTFAAFMRVILAKGLWGEHAESLVDLLQWLAVLTMLVGNIAAILQNNFKRMLAYSSIAHSGYALIGLIAAGVGETGVQGASGLIFYLFSYSIMTMGAFAFISLFEKYEGTLVHIDDLKGVATRHPWISLGLTVCLLSLAGIPPTLGFFGKFYIFSAAINEGLIWLAVWGVINSVISVYYYLRPIVVCYMMEDSKTELAGHFYLSRAAVLLSALLLIVAGLFSSPIYQIVQASVATLFS
jgi:NADH-quinone oxidoreductase subunit N